ncbi:MAG: FG-GAP repeat protein [Planctomycetes bacterium]|nr:FG-GAP repeat protein [Planctomycetota bacterium]
MNSLPNDLLRARRNRAAWLLAGLVGLGLASCGGGGKGSSSAQSLVQVQAVSPATGPFIGGTAVTLTGRTFDLEGLNTVTFGGVPATDVVAIDDRTIACVTPPGTPGARVDVVVSNDRGQGRLALGFLYASPPPPTSDVNGDGIADLLISSPADSAGGSGAGAVYIYFGRSQSFQLDGLNAGNADLKLIGQKPGDAFGSCVCVGDADGDGAADLLVGAPKVDGIGALDAGAVYVFRGPLAAGPTLPAQAAAIKLSGSNAVAGDEFGAALELADLDGDGRPDLMVGAPKHDVQGRLDAGCVYVFRGGPTLASRSADQADHGIDGVAAGDLLGARLACGDVDGDGLVDLVFGAGRSDIQRDVLLHDAGRVYVIPGASAMAFRSAGEALIVFEGLAAGDRLGEAVCVADLDGDGVLDIVASAPGVDTGEVDAGAVYVFRGGAGLASGLASSAHARILGIANSGPIGQALRAGDFDGDSIADLLIGAPDATGLATRDGVIFVFRGGATLRDGTVADAHAVLYGGGQLLEGFGSALSALDLDGDGFADLLGATPRWSGMGRIQAWRGGVGAVRGAMYALDADVVIEGNVLGGRFGESVARGQ